MKWINPRPGSTARLLRDLYGLRSDVIALCAGMRMIMVMGVLMTALMTGLMTVLMTSAAAATEVSANLKPLTVMAMIKAESDYLAKWQAQQRKLTARARPAPSLLSIYGVLPQLRATVLVNGREVVFEQGQTRPVQVHGAHRGALRLRYIKPPCVSFVHQAKRRTLCLPMVGS